MMEIIFQPFHLQERSILDLVFNHQRWQDRGLWDDPCLRIGWIQGLKNLLQHPAALDFSVKSGNACRKDIQEC